MNSFYDRLNTVSVLPGANPSSIDIMFDELPQSKRPAGKTLVPSSEFDRLSLEELLHNGGNNPHSLLNALAFFKLLEAGSLHRATERTVSNKETEYLLAMGNVGAFAVAVAESLKPYRNKPFIGVPVDTGFQQINNTSSQTTLVELKKRSLYTLRHIFGDGLAELDYAGTPSTAINNGNIDAVAADSVKKQVYNSIIMKRALEGHLKGILANPAFSEYDGSSSSIERVLNFLDL